MAPGFLQQAMEKPFAMIIEDDRDVAALFRHVLDMAGYRTEIVGNGKTAVKRLDTVQPDIVLLDLNLPGISGIRILEHMHADARLLRIPVVVITGHSEVADSLPIEPDLILLKPVNLDQLSRLVQRLRTTPGSLRDEPWDEPTHLYNRSFFSMRASYSLERANQSDGNRFGIVFADLVPFPSLQPKLSETQRNTLLHQMGTCLKKAVRPTDTIARIREGLFLILIDDVAGADVPDKIMGRVQLEVEKYLASQQEFGDLRVCIGLLLCDSGYQSVQEIMHDVELARGLSRSRGGNIVYRQETLQGD